MLQVYCGDERSINQWLQENPTIQIRDLKLTSDEYGELIMAVYETEIT